VVTPKEITRFTVEKVVTPKEITRLTVVKVVTSKKLNENGGLTYKSGNIK